MKISKSSWHYKLNIFCFDEFSGNNFCNYWWRTIFAILILPLAFLGYKINKQYPELYSISRECRYCTNYAKGTYVISMTSLLLMLATLILGTYITGLWFVPYLIAFEATSSSLAGILSVFGTHTLIVGILLVNTSAKVVEATSLTASFAVAKAKRLCPLINWQD